ncbi:MAG: UDP-N-acetylmuramoyl-L-alanine--D-glutamate ligase [Defluviitaleaceae bacterium]|nr:UDP-N-acetylmuramoyl-L-alanine--D-glutamate ligase [Defluviitaleaceae bacterium]
MDFKNKKVLVAGLGRSGIAAARLLQYKQALVTIQDIKEEDRIGADMVAKLANEGFELYLGRNPVDIVQNYDILVISPGIPIDVPFIEKAKKLKIPVWGEIELAYTFTPCPIIAITGTNGKTTTTALTGEIMRRKYPNAAVVGNIGIAYCEKVEALTPESYVVAEVSSFQLESVHEFRPTISAVLNISQDHLNRHYTMEVYVGTKERIFGKQGEQDFCVLNYDDEVTRKMSARCRAKVLYFSRRQELEEGVFLDGENIRARLFGRDDTIINVHEMKIIGGHNIENALAATAMALAAQVCPADIAAALRQFNAVEHRLEYVLERDGVAYYNDSKATNVDSAIKSLEAIARPIVLIGGGYDKGSDFSEWVKLFSGKVKHLIVIGEVADKITQTCKLYDYTAITQANSLKDAVSIASGKAKRGDVVLLSPACASFDMFDDFEQRGRLFKEFVRG